MAIIKFFIKKFKDPIITDNYGDRANRPYAIYFVRDDNPRLALWWCNRETYNDARQELVFLRRRLANRQIDLEDNMLYRWRSWKGRPATKNRHVLELDT
jgi:hypothetical protein